MHRGFLGVVCVLLCCASLVSQQMERVFQDSFDVAVEPLRKFGHKWKDQADLLLVTMPRTGTNLLLAIMNDLTEREGLWMLHPIEKSGKCLRGVWLNRGCVCVDQSAFPILGTHIPRDVLPYKLQSRLVTTLRDYKEVLCREGRHVPHAKEMQSYYGFLDLYDRWPESKRWLVHYEDMLEDPEAVVESLGRFLGVSEQHIAACLAFLPELKKRVLASYQIHPGGSKNPGQDIAFHQKEIAESHLKALEKKMMESNPKLYQKYLKRYSR